MTICCFVTDTKNSIGLAGCIEEVAHNAIAVYWNPLESAAKVPTLTKPSHTHLHINPTYKFRSDAVYIQILMG